MKPAIGTSHLQRLAGHRDNRLPTVERVPDRETCLRPFQRVLDQGGRTNAANASFRLLQKATRRYGNGSARALSSSPHTRHYTGADQHNIPIPTGLCPTVWCRSSGSAGSVTGPLIAQRPPRVRRRGASYPQRRPSRFRLRLGLHNPPDRRSTTMTTIDMMTLQALLEKSGLTAIFCAR